MKSSLLLIFFVISIPSFSQDNKYFRHLRYNHVSPYIDMAGIHPIDSSTASKTSHYVFKYSKLNGLVEILNNHYHTEKVHPLASLGVYKVVFSYEDGKEIRTFYDPNNNRIANDRNVYKEVYLLDERHLRNATEFLRFRQQTNGV